MSHSFDLRTIIVDEYKMEWITSNLFKEIFCNEDTLEHTVYMQLLLTTFLLLSCYEKTLLQTTEKGFDFAFLI